MSYNITIALVQTDLIWKNKIANLDNLKRLVDTITQPIDIIILPELFNTAFCIDDISLAEDKNGITFAFMKEIAQSRNCAVCGSFLFKEDNNIYNRFVFIEENYTTFYYDKHYLFSLVNEDKQLNFGKQKVVIEYKNWKIQPFICYDIRFPAWCQNDDNVDAQIYVASWPQKRIHHWQTLLQARAIENQCYTVGVNRIGNDFYGNAHNGNSMVYDFAGNLLANMEDRNGIEIVTLSKENLQQHKLRYPFWKDR